MAAWGLAGSPEGPRSSRHQERVRDIPLWGEGHGWFRTHLEPFTPQPGRCPTWPSSHALLRVRYAR